MIDCREIIRLKLAGYSTSSFTREAIQYAKNQQQKRLKLIDGDELAKSMIK